MQSWGCLVRRIRFHCKVMIHFWCIQIYFPSIFIQWSNYFLALARICNQEVRMKTTKVLWAQQGCKAFMQRDVLSVTAHAVCWLSTIRWCESSTDSISPLPDAWGTAWTPLPLHFLMHSIGVRTWKARWMWWKLLGLDRGRVTKQVHRHLKEREAHTEKGKKRAGSVLVEDDFLVTCLGGASERRAGRITRCCIVCNGLNGECSVRIGVRFCFSHLLWVFRPELTVDLRGAFANLDMRSTKEEKEKAGEWQKGVWFCLCVLDGQCNGLGNDQELRCVCVSGCGNACVYVYVCVLVFTCLFVCFDHTRGIRECCTICGTIILQWRFRTTFHRESYNLTTMTSVHTVHTCLTSPTVINNLFYFNLFPLCGIVLRYISINFWL